MSRYSGIEELHTFDEWVAKGARVKKGEKSCSRNAQGKPQFSSDQVWYPDKVREADEPEVQDTFDRFQDDRKER